MSIAILARSFAVPLSNRRRESIVLGYGVQLLRTVSLVVTMWRRAAARVAAGVRHARVSGRSVFIGRAVTGTFWPPLQKFGNLVNTRIESVRKKCLI